MEITKIVIYAVTADKEIFYHVNLKQSNIKNLAINIL